MIEYIADTRTDEREWKAIRHKIAGHNMMINYYQRYIKTR